jgi:RNA polymerase sigma factor (sigma-70 family)
MTRVTRPEPDLIEQPAAEEPSSTFEDFFRAEHTRLLRALFLVTGTAHEAEDIMQEAFVKLWERWDRVGTMSDPVGYLYRTAMNAFRSRTRRAATAVRRALTPSAADPFAAIEAKDEAARALARLTRRQRLALVLTEYLGYTSEDAAPMMGVKPATVRVLAHQGRQALQGTRDE